MMTHNFRADLHCHSTFSDGSQTPEQLIDLACQIGLSGLSITDHDTMGAYPQAFDYAKKRGIQLISGIELSSCFRTEPVHILGYGFDIENKAIQALCGRHANRRHERNLQILKKLSHLGIQIRADELDGLGSIGRPHIAQLLIQKGIVSSIKEAFDRYLAEGKLAYSAGTFVSVEETIETIHKAGGVAVLAHPHLIRRSTTVKGVLKLPFDGIECYYARFGPEQEKKWLLIAQQKKWIATGGSDFHGDGKPHNALGSSWVDEETFGRLKASTFSYPRMV